MSQEGKVANFVFKTLSLFLGAMIIPESYEKIILIEKSTALEIFGCYPGYGDNRRGYFHTYVAVALSLGIENPEELEEYGKQRLLRYKQKPNSLELPKSLEWKYTL